MDNKKSSTQDCLPLEEIKKTSSHINANKSLMATVNFIPFMACIVNKQRQIIAANNQLLDRVEDHSLESILGKRPGEVLGCPWGEDNGCGKSHRCKTCVGYNAIANALETHSATQVEGELVTRFGTISVDIHAAPIEIEDEKFIIVSLQDITHRKKIEREKEKMIKEVYTQSRLSSLNIFISGLAHEINNPLAIASGHLNKLLDHYAQNPDKQLQFSLDKIKESTERIRKIIRQLMDTTSEEKDFPSAVDINQMLKQISNYLIQVYNSTATLHFSTNEVELLVECDTGDLQKIFMNILDNAFASISQKENHYLVSIRTEKNEQSICIEIKDNGMGIPQEFIDRVFDPYFSSKISTGNFGINMSITRTLVEKWKGQIKIQSNANEGTTVLITLPTKKS